MKKAPHYGVLLHTAGQCLLLVKKVPGTIVPGIYGGLKGDRTLGLCVANAALSQLSYEP